MQQTIAYYTDSAGFGGAEQIMLTLIQGLDRQRWQPLLIHHGDPGLTPLLRKAEHMHVQHFVVPRMPDGKGVLCVPRLVRLLHALRPTIFHANLTWQLSCKFGLLAAIMVRLRVIVATEHLFVDLPHDWLMLLEQRYLARGVTRYIAVSHDIARRLHSAFDYEPGKVQVIHNGINVPSPNNCAMRELRMCLEGNVERPVILTPARLDHQKGHRYLLEAARFVPDARFVFAGDGPERVELEAEARSLGIDERVLFLGQRADIADLLACCDLFVLPSLFEGLPLSVLEAMAAAKPVIATGIGGTDEVVVHDKSGLLVPPADPTALAQAIQMLLRDPAFAQQLGQAGHARMQQLFSAERMVQQITALYDNLLGDHEASYAAP